MANFTVPYTIHVMSGPPDHVWLEWNHDHLCFTDKELAWALFVTGRATGDEFKHGEWLGLWEYASRYGTVRAYIESCWPDTDLYQTELAGFLDPTEKGNLSYALGQALTGIFCQDILTTKRMLHIDYYGAQLDAKGCRRVVLDGSRKRPDLFGYGSNFRVIVEAKGRATASMRKRNELAGKMRSQLDAVLKIDGSCTDVDWKIGLLTVTSATRPAHLHVFVYPDGPLYRRPTQSQVMQDLYIYYAELDPGYPELNYSLVDQEALLTSSYLSAAPYYRRFTRTLQTLTDDQFTEHGFWKVRLSAIGVTIGISIEIVELVSRFSAQSDGISHTRLAQFTEQIDAAILRARRDNDSVLQDGTGLPPESWSVGLGGLGPLVVVWAGHVVGGV